MIIDRILDRKDGDTYDPRSFYAYCNGYGGAGDEIAHAMDELDEEDVKQAICAYIIRNEYNEDICEYVRSVDWITKGA